MDKAGIDVLLVTSKHNIQYLLGGYRFFFFDFMDAIGVSRYLPVMIYPKGRPDQAAYFGNGLETYERQLDKFWPSTVETEILGHARCDEACRRSPEEARRHAQHRRRNGLPAGRCAWRLERGDAQLPRSSMRWCRWKGCARVKTPEELALVAQGFRGRGRLDAGGDGVAWPGRHQEAR